MKVCTAVTDAQYAQCTNTNKEKCASNPHMRLGASMRKIFTTLFSILAGNLQQNIKKVTG